MYEDENEDYPDIDVHEEFDDGEDYWAIAAIATFIILLCAVIYNFVPGFK